MKIDEIAKLYDDRIKNIYPDIFILDHVALLKPVNNFFNKPLYWKNIKTNPPKKTGNYLCHVPEQKKYNEHKEFYYWDGEKFLDNGFIGNGRIVEVTYYLNLTNESTKNK